MRYWPLLIFCLIIETTFATEPFCPSAPSKCSFKTVKEDLWRLDDKPFIGLDSPHSVCQSGIKNISNPEAVQSSLLSDSRFSSYVNPQILNCWQGSQGSADFKSKALVRYAYLQKRLDQTSRDLMDYLAFADGLEGKEPLSGVSCQAAPELAMTVQECEKIKKSCPKNRNAAAENARHFDKTYADEGIGDLENEMKSMDQQISQAKGDSEKIQVLQKTKALGSLKLMQFYSSYPWALQDTFKEAKAKGHTTKAAMQVQVSQNAEAARKQLQELSHASSCLLRGNCTNKELHKALDHTSPLPAEFKIKSGNTAETMVTSHIAYNNCLDDMGIAQRKTSESLRSSSVMAAGALLTFGGSVAVSGLKVGSKLFQAGKAAVSIGAVVDGGFAVSQLSEAAALCTEKAKAQAKGMGASSTAVACNGPTAQMLEFKKEHDDCVMQAAMAGLGIVPGALALKSLGKAKSLEAAAAKKANLDRADEALKLIKNKASKEEILKVTGKIDDTVDGGAARLKLAEGVLGRPLNESEKKWVMAAHHTADDVGYGEIGTERVRAKIKAGDGRPRSVTSENTKDLMKNGVLGHSSEKVAVPIPPEIVKTKQLATEEMAQRVLEKISKPGDAALESQYRTVGDLIAKNPGKYQLDEARAKDIATGFYEKAREVDAAKIERLSKSSSFSEFSAREYEKLGDLTMKTGNVDKAVEVYNLAAGRSQAELVEITKQIGKDYRSSPSWLRERAAAVVEKLTGQLKSRISGAEYQELLRQTRDLKH